MAFRRWKATTPARRILFWPIAITLACGLLEIGMPLDRLFENARDAIRSRAADGQIVVVKIDDRTVKLLPWPARRVVEAKVTDTLFELGARRVIFDLPFATPSMAGDDAAMVRAFERHRGRVVVGARFEVDRATGVRRALRPIPSVRASAMIGTYNVRLNAIGYVSGIPYAGNLGGTRYPSLAAILAGKSGGVDELFEPDFAIEYLTIPAVSMVDVVRRGPGASVVAGRDVIVGTTAESLGDIRMVPRQGPIPGVYIHAIAAETLRRATPLELGWWPFYAFAVAAAVAYVHTPTRRSRVAMAVGSAAALAFVPVALDAHNMEVDVVPATLLFGCAVVRRWLYARKGANPVSGLPTLVPSRHEAVTWPATIVGLKLRNYLDLRATLSDREDKAVVAEVVRRLRIAGSVDELMHVDDAFIWRTDLPASQPLFDHIEGLFAIMSSPIEVESRRLDLSVAFGIDDERDAALSHRVGNVQISADRAGSVGSKFQVHDPKEVIDVDFRLSLPSRIDAAIAAGEIWVAYQPKLALREKQVSGAEALIRWTHPERGAIRPDEFIPAVEQANRIDRLTYFVLDTAMRDARKMDAIAPHFTVAVNLSARSLDDSTFAGRVVSMLREHGLAPSRLTLEITESFPLHADGPALRTLHELRAVGVNLSIDDYGTKFSTLQYLGQIPASEIKIDQLFIRNVHTEKVDEIMVAHTINLAHDLGLRVVAEGVESPAAMDKLRKLGCDVVQGYLIGRPEPFEKLAGFFHNIERTRQWSGYRIANYG